MNPEKTPIIKYVVLITILLIVGVFCLLVLPDAMKPKTTLKIGGGVFNTWVAYDENSREKGLSGLSQIDDGQALLMAFPENGQHGIWMKDMKFAIDIVWLDQNKEVIYIVKDVPADVSTSKTFAPTKGLAKYVLEFRAGTVAKKAINRGSVADFEIDENNIN